MKTISVVSTQMQLINCVEYLFQTHSDSNILIVTTKSRYRKKQLCEILENKCYSKYFYKIIYLSMTNIRFFDFFHLIIYTLYIRVFCLFKKFDICLLGNYRDFLGRLLYRYLRSDELIVVDDGLASLSIEAGRHGELKEYKSPYIFIPNRLIRFFCHNNTRFIPNKVNFFTIYDLKIFGNDLRTSNNYIYLKKISNTFNIPDILRQADAIFVGQPLYRNYLSKDKYAWYLRQYAKNVHGSIVYYPHPEETYKEWLEMRLNDNYIYVENKFSFELLLSCVKENVNIVSFFSSILSNAKHINQLINLEAVYLSEIDNNQTLSYLQLSYNKFKDEGIKILVYEDI